MLTFLRFMKFSKIKDPYEVLGLARNATMAQIKEAYLSLSKKCIDVYYLDHPDLNSSDDA